MRYLAISALTVLAMVVAASFAFRINSMSENEKYLKEAQEKINAFKSEMEPERLKESARALENLNLAIEYDSEVRHDLRRRGLRLWLTLVQILDEHIDPEFDSKDVPKMSVQPPQTSDGTLLPPGADPADIDDPKARAEYEKAIAENRKKQDNYRLQIKLGRIDKTLPGRAEAFIKNCYSDSEEDQNELKAAIEELIEKQERKDRLMSLLNQPQT